MKFKTISGSIYDIEFDGTGGRIRRLEGNRDNTRRITEEWRRFEAVDINQFGGITIYWGTGRDEASDTAVTTGSGPDEHRVRITVTSPIVECENPDTGEMEPTPFAPN